MLWEELYSHEFGNAVKESRGVCLVPVGCVETHGNHIALGCDTLICQERCRIAAEKEPAVVFPGMFFGEKSGAGEYPGTIIFPGDLIFDILEETCYEIARNGFTKIFLVNGHGGNTDMLTTFTRQIIQKNPDFLVFTGVGRTGLTLQYIPDHREKYPYLTDEDVAIVQSYIDEGKFDGHGGFCETSLALATDPAIVKKENFGTLDGKSVVRFPGMKDARLYSPYSWMANYPNSLSCDYHEGINERIARAFMDYSTDLLAENIKFLKEDTVAEEYMRTVWKPKQKPHSFL